MMMLVKVRIKIARMMKVSSNLRSEGRRNLADRQD